MSDTTVDDTFPAMSLGRLRKRRKILAGIVIGGLLAGGAGLPGLVPGPNNHNHPPEISSDIPTALPDIRPSISGTAALIIQSAGAGTFAVDIGGKPAAGR
jgi:hypothetical protein